MNAIRKLIALSWFDFLVVTLFAAILLIATWGILPDVQVDFGRELYIPWQIALGKVLYRDIAHFNGPLSQYLNALLFKIFGPGLAVLEISNFFIFLGSLFFIRRLLRDVTTHRITFFCLIFFVSVFGMNRIVENGNSNFITPYSHETVHGFFLSLWTLERFRFLLSRPTKIRFLSLGILLGLLHLTKLEFFIPVLAAVSVGLMISFLQKSSKENFWANVRNILVLSAGFSGVLLLATLILACGSSVSIALQGIFSPWYYISNPEITESTFYVKLRGLDELSTNLKLALHYSISILGFSLGLVGWEYWTTKLRPLYRRFVVLATFVVLVAILYRTEESQFWWDLWVVLPYFLIIFLAVLGGRMLHLYISGKSVSPRNIFVFSAGVYSLLLLSKIFFKTTIHWYGAFLAGPATLVAIVVLMDGGPKFLQKRNQSSRLFSFVMAIILLAFGFFNVRLTQTQKYRLTVAVGEGRDRFYAGAEGQLVNTFFDWAKREMSSNATFVVLPEGIMLNYLMRRVNPSRYVNFMPTEFALFGVENILGSIRESKPDYIVLMTRDTSEHGVQFFDRGYGREFIPFIASEYSSIALAGDEPFTPGAELGIQVFRRKDFKPSLQNSRINDEILGQKSL